MQPQLPQTTKHPFLAHLNLSSYRNATFLCPCQMYFLLFANWRWPPTVPPSETFWLCIAQEVNHTVFGWWQSVFVFISMEPPFWTGSFSKSIGHRHPIARGMDSCRIVVMRQPQLATLHILVVVVVVVGVVVVVVVGVVVVVVDVVVVVAKIENWKCCACRTNRNIHALMMQLLLISRKIQNKWSQLAQKVGVKKELKGVRERQISDQRIF